MKIVFFSLHTLLLLCENAKQNFSNKTWKCLNNSLFCSELIKFSHAPKLMKALFLPTCENIYREQFWYVFQLLNLFSFFSIKLFFLFVHSSQLLCRFTIEMKIWELHCFIPVLHEHQHLFFGLVNERAIFLRVFLPLFFP